MKKLLFFIGFICATILLELFYINFQLDKRITNIENHQKQYHFSIESIDQISNQTLMGIDQTINSKTVLVVKN